MYAELPGTHTHAGAREKAGHDGVLVPCQRGRLEVAVDLHGEHPAANGVLALLSGRSSPVLQAARCHSK
jgi:hypothetical protein